MKAFIKCISLLIRGDIFHLDYAGPTIISHPRVGDPCTTTTTIIIIVVATDGHSRQMVKEVSSIISMRSSLLQCKKVILESERNLLKDKLISRPTLSYAVVK